MWRQSFCRAPGGVRGPSCFGLLPPFPRWSGSSPAGLLWTISSQHMYGISQAPQLAPGGTVCVPWDWGHQGWTHRGEQRGLENHSVVVQTQLPTGTETPRLLARTSQEWERTCSWLCGEVSILSYVIHVFTQQSICMHQMPACWLHTGIQRFSRWLLGTTLWPGPWTCKNKNSKYIFSTYCRAGTVVNTLYVWTHVILTTALQSGYYYHPQFIVRKESDMTEQSSFHFNV